MSFVDKKAYMFIHDEDGRLSPLDTGEIMLRLCGFGGSAGVAIVGGGVKLFASDARYEIQMTKELGEDWFSVLDNKNLPTKLFGKLKEAGVDNLVVIGDFCSYSGFVKIESYLQNLIKVDCASFNSVAKHFSMTDIFNSSSRARYFQIPRSATTTMNEKIKEVRKHLKPIISEEKVDLLYVGNKNFISWMTSERLLRGHNRAVDYDAILDIGKDNNVTRIKTWKDIEKLGKMHKRSGVVLMDPDHTSASNAICLMNIFEKVVQQSLASLYFLSNKKTPLEIMNMKSAHVKDGIAICGFLHWLENSWFLGSVSEQVAADKVLSLRAKQKGFCEPSFRTISAFGENGAIVHYSSPSSTAILQDGGLYLLDSGGQYMFGTTDLTRTVAIGKPSNEHISMFTLVLKCHIALATSVFTKHTKGSVLDNVCRKNMAKMGLDYQHGTGHGVGYFGNVHEGPVSISKYSECTFDIGVVVSNEPGFYKKGHYGIRIESLMAVVSLENKDSDFYFTGKSLEEAIVDFPSIDEAHEDCDASLVASHVGEEKMLAFESISLVPMDVRLIDVASLTSAEKNWVNVYHEKVRRKLLRHADKGLKDWLKLRTRLI
jgi:Xaa-Pro aminopeptidase